MLVPCRRWSAALALILLASTRAYASPITLDQAFQRSAKRPLIQISGSSAQAARARAGGAQRPLYNPELSVAAGPRFGGGSTLFDFQVTLSQTLELGGKRSARQEAAAARLGVAEAELGVATLNARIETQRAFQVALVLRERMTTLRDAQQLAIEIDKATAERLRAGSGTQLQVNLSSAELGRARHELLDAERKYEQAVATLASAIGAEASERIEPDGKIELPPELTATVDQLTEQALRQRQDLRAARAEIEAARADVRAADALATPDVTLGISYAYEQDPDLKTHAVLGSVSIPLMIRNRNQGERGATRALAKRADLDAARVTTEIRREIAVAVNNYKTARLAVLGFSQEVNERLRENLELARESYTSGKIDYFVFNTVRRELIANRIAYLDALEEVTDSWSALQAATGGQVTL